MRFHHSDSTNKQAFHVLISLSISLYEFNSFLATYSCARSLKRLPFAAGLLIKRADRLVAAVAAALVTASDEDASCKVISDQSLIRVIYSVSI